MNVELVKALKQHSSGSEHPAMLYLLWLDPCSSHHPAIPWFPDSTARISKAREFRALDRTMLHSIDQPGCLHLPGDLFRVTL